MNTEKMKQVKLLSILIAALAIVSCRPSSNQPTSESSASDSVELKKQEAWESAHRLDSMGNHREALLLRERTLSEYCPNSAECLQYKGLRCYIENKQDSANFYFDKAMRMCDMALHDSLDINMVTIKAFVLAFTNGDRSTQHFLDSLSTRHHDNQALQQLKESTEGIRNVVVIKSLKLNVVQHAFLIKKGTMKYSLVIIFATSLLAACSNNDEITVTPDHPHTYLNTGKLLSMDGGNEHLAFSYDSEGRVAFAERVDSGSFLVKQQADYLYDNDCIYVTFREFAQLPNGEHDSNYTRDFCHYDTLFLANGRVDSLAGHRPSSRHVQANRFFFKFHYNEQGQLISIRNDNFNYIYQDKINETPWYTEL